MPFPPLKPKGGGEVKSSLSSPLTPSMSGGSLDPPPPSYVVLRSNAARAAHDAKSGGRRIGIAEMPNPFGSSSDNPSYSRHLWAALSACLQSKSQPLPMPVSQVPSAAVIYPNRGCPTVSSWLRARGLTVPASHGPNPSSILPVAPKKPQDHDGGHRSFQASSPSFDLFPSSKSDLLSVSALLHLPRGPSLAFPNINPLRFPVRKWTDANYFPVRFATGCLKK